MRAWRLSEIGDPWEKMEVQDVTIPGVPDGTCRIAVEATDLNFADILQCQGHYQVALTPPFTPGMTSAGRVLEAADDVSLSTGDRVIGHTFESFGGYADECLIEASSAILIPEGVRGIEAAAMYVTYGTGWFGLHVRCGLKPGQTVLVLAGAGGVGSAAIDLAKAHGCRVIAAAGSEEKTSVCTRMGADEVIDYNKDDLYQVTMDLTEGRGVDLVYDPVGGDYFDIARRLVAWEGNYVVIGFASGRIPDAPMNHALVKNYSLVGLHLGGYRGRDDLLLQRSYEELFQMLKDGRINPFIDKVVGFYELPHMLVQLADRKTKGRVVFDPSR